MKHYEDLNMVLKRLNINNIITNDIESWEIQRDHNKIYNKLWLIDCQNIDCGPIGTNPTQYPIIIKPIINLYGMSKGFKKIKDKEEYLKNQDDGTFWMPYFEGDNFTIDLIIDKGKIVGYYALESFPDINGTFKYHKYQPNYKLSDKNYKFIEDNLKGYSGPLNIEIINNNIIEAHLRLNGDYYLYDDNFIINLSRLISGDNYNLNVSKKVFYLFPYFVDSSFKLEILNKEEIENIISDKKVDNIRWDNIYSEYQRVDLSRLLMFKTSKKSIGEEVLFEIRRNIYLRSMIYQEIIL